MQPYSDEQKELILSAIRSRLPKGRVLVFGSRVRGDFKKYSDLDIALSLTDHSKIKLSDLSLIEEQLSNSNLPFKVDIIDFNAVDSTFQELIQKNSIIWG